MKFQICVSVFATLFCLSIAQEFTQNDARSAPTAGKYSKHSITKPTGDQILASRSSD